VESDYITSLALLLLANSTITARNSERDTGFTFGHAVTSIVGEGQQGM